LYSRGVWWCCAPSVVGALAVRLYSRGVWWCCAPSVVGALAVRRAKKITKREKKSGAPLWARRCGCCYSVYAFALAFLRARYSL